MKMNIKLLLLLIFLAAAAAQNTRQHHSFEPQNFLARAAPSDGWESWSEWSPCSRSCGGGVRERQRNCRERRQSKNPFSLRCAGSSKMYQPCNNILCRDGSTNSEFQQCSKYNTRQFAGITYIWEPFTQVGPCKLKCKARGHRFFIRHSSTVTDGMDCSSTPPQMKNGRFQRGGIPKFICVEGQCQVVGCDGNIGSGVVEDKCGVCGGNGDTCEVINGIFRTQHLNNDFYTVVRIPIGAIKINITELSQSRSCLALRSANPGGRFYINGEMNLGHLDPSQRYQIAGTYVTYTRPYQSEKGETIVANGPITEALEVLFFHQGENPGVFYEFTVPLTPPPDPVRQQLPFSSNRHSLLDTHSDPNMVIPPNQPNVPLGSSGVYGRNPYQSVAPSNRGNYPLNYQNRFYHPPPNHYQHVGHRYQVPSSSYQTPIVMPFHANVRRKMASNSGHYPSQILPFQYPDANPLPSSRQPMALPGPDDDDDDEEKTESTNTRREAIPVNRHEPVPLPESVGPTRWRSRGWGPCSKSCGEGFKTTMVVCEKISTREEVDVRYCTRERPNSKIRKCNRKSCPASYVASTWSECSKTCGNGRRTRTVVCRQQFSRNFSAVVSHRQCRGQERPTSHERCKVQDCARWEIGEEWNSCNVKCGTGIQRRRAVCRGGDGSVLSDDSCSSSRRPNNIRSCDAGPCVTRWYVTNWEECSADCDSGVQRRHVFCLNTRESPAGCSAGTEPDNSRTCSRSTCGVKHEWFTGQWGPCSSKCGSGNQERKVACMVVNPDGTMLLSNKTDVPCDHTEKPSTQQPCNTQSCGARWHYTPWTACSVSCGGGSRTRDVQCFDADGEFSSLCNFDDRPKETERCNTLGCMEVQKPDCEDRLRRCHVVMQARLCVYPYYRKMCCNTCSTRVARQTRQRP